MRTPRARSASTRAAGVAGDADELEGVAMGHHFNDDAVCGQPSWLLGPGSRGISRGFVCRPASPFGAQPCQRLCLCRDTLPPAAVCSAPP
jgi:hypothetical protein